jgi:hypothetical protein
MTGIATFRQCLGNNSIMDYIDTCSKAFLRNNLENSVRFYFQIPCDFIFKFHAILFSHMLVFEVKNKNFTYTYLDCKMCTLIMGVCLHIFAKKSTLKTFFSDAYDPVHQSNLYEWNMWCWVSCYKLSVWSDCPKVKFLPKFKSRCVVTLPDFIEYCNSGDRIVSIW